MKKRLRFILQDPIIGWCPRTKQPIRARRNHSKPINWYKWIVFTFLFLIFLMCLSGCSSYTPLLDDRGKSSANIDGDSNRQYDDLSTCRMIADDNTNEIINGSKIVYNKMRWRILWLSPKLKTKNDIINKCMEGRGHSVLN